MFEMIISFITPFNLVVIAFGTTWGIAFGVIPGLTATLAIVVLIPITYGMNVISGLSMLIGIYIGGIAGGLVTSILIGMPGTPSSIATVLDGFPMAKKGLGTKALGIAVTSSLIGSIFGGILLITLAPEIARLALRFGPFEYVAVIIFGLTAVIGLSGDSLSKGLMMAAFGLLVSTIGTDPIYGVPRNTFGIRNLLGGVSPIPAMIGLFVVSQAFTEAEQMAQKFIIPKPEKIKGFFSFFTAQELRESVGNFIRSGFIGLLVGILPGIGGSLSNVLAYDQAKKMSKHPETFGTGNIQGVIAPETANNATVGGSLIPMLSLGIPGDAATAALLGGLMLHGLQPGPLMFKENPEIVYSVFVSYFIATVMMFVIMMLGIRVFPLLLRLPKSLLMPLVLVASLVGCYNLQYSMNDMWISLAFGFFGFIFKKLGFPFTPVVISMVLGRMLENSLRIGLLNSDGSMMPLFTRPVALVCMILSVISLAMSFTKLGKGAK